MIEITRMTMWSDDSVGWTAEEIEASHFGIGFGKGGGGQNTVTTKEIPEWLQVAGQENWNMAKNVADRPYQQYDGQRVAGLNGDNQQVANRVRGMQGTAAAQIGEAQNYTRFAGNYDPSYVSSNFAPPGVNSGSVLDNLSAYQNPYTEQVINSSLGTLDQQRLQSLNQTGDQARSAGAFGGSRHGIMEGVVNSASNMQAAQMAAQLRSQGYTQALGAAESDRNASLNAQQANQQATITANGQNLNAQQGNQQAGLAAAGLRMQAGQQLAGLAGQQNALTNSELSLLDTVGNQNRAVDQAGLDVQYQNWLDSYNAPVTALGIRNTAIGLQPYNVTTNQATSGGAGSGVGQALGAGAAAAGIAGTVYNIASDPRLKTDVEHVGEDPATGLGVYAFRYKDDVAKHGRGIPKVLGLMADEVAEEDPEASTQMGGILGIDASKLDPSAAVKRAASAGLLMSDEEMPKPTEVKHVAHKKPKKAVKKADRDD